MSSHASLGGQPPQVPPQCQRIFNDHPSLDDEPPLKKQKLIMIEELAQHACIRVNFVRIASFLQWHELTPFRSIIDRDDIPYITDPYLLAIKGNTRVLDFNLRVRKCNIKHNLLAEAAALGDKEYIFFYLFRKFEFFPSFELILKVARMGATRCLLFLLQLYPVRDSRILANCAASTKVQHFRVIRSLGFPLSHQCVVQAIKSGSLEMLRHLMDLDCTHKPKMTAATAAEYGTIESIRFLMSRRVGFPPMCFTVAVLRKRQEVIDLLIEYGVSPHRSAIHAVLIRGDIETLNKFIDKAKITLSDDFVVSACAGRGGKHQKILMRLIELGLKFPETPNTQRAGVLRKYYNDFTSWVGSKSS